MNEESLASFGAFLGWILIIIALFMATDIST